MKLLHYKQPFIEFGGGDTDCAFIIYCLTCTNVISSATWICLFHFDSALFCLLWHGIPDAVSLGIQIAKTVILVVFMVSLL